MIIDIPLFSGLSLKIDDDHHGKKEYPTARLQKGLLLLDHGQELSDEGVGFGVPVLKKRFKTIFPGEVALTCLRNGPTWEITAKFKLNLIEKISTRKDEYVESRLIYAVKHLLAAMMRRLPFARDLLTSVSSKVRELFNWETTYAYSNFSTDLEVIYKIDPEIGKLTVEIDANHLPRDITEVVLMNEQGACVFNQYLDTSGIALEGEKIGCWDEVNADQAWFASTGHKILFKLSQVKGARLFRGREFIGSRLAWAGFGYSFPPSIKNIRYEMSIERLT